MKSLKITALVSALALSLSGCASIQAILPQEPVSMIGLSGTDLTNVVKTDDLNVDDTLMLWACRKLHTYQTNESLDDSGVIETLDEGTSKKELRDTGLFQLKLLAPEYPEVQIFIDGVTQELATGDGSDEGYVAFVKSCKTYEKVQENIQENYLTPATIYASCWNDKHIKVTLQEEVDGKWVEYVPFTKLSKTKHCASDKKYPWGAQFSMSRTISGLNRTIRVVYKTTDGSKFDNKKSTLASPSQDLTSLDDEVFF